MNGRRTSPVAYARRTTMPRVDSGGRPCAPGRRGPPGTPSFCRWNGPATVASNSHDRRADAPHLRPGGEEAEPTLVPSARRRRRLRSLTPDGCESSRRPSNGAAASRPAIHCKTRRLRPACRGAPWPRPQRPGRPRCRSARLESDWSCAAYEDHGSAAIVAPGTMPNARSGSTTACRMHPLRNCKCNLRLLLPQETQQSQCTRQSRLPIHEW